MIASFVQRWRDRRGFYRPAGEPIATNRYEVAVIPDDKTAEAFVVRHHYAASYPAARFRVGLYRGAELVGLVVLSQPMHNAVLAPLRLSLAESAELGRLVLLDDVPANGESWLVARAFELARAAGFRGIVSDADPMLTRDVTGRVVCRGHVGTVYQATNAVYFGQTDRRTRYLLPDGRVFLQRGASKIRNRERGWQGAAAKLERYGAPHLGEREDARAWLTTWLPRLTRRVRHPGNHRYLFALDKHARRLLPPTKPYPKLAGIS
jgi:hypothetical protein